MTLFPDISHHQKIINWDQAFTEGGVRKAIIRVSDGLRYPDTFFDRNVDECRRLGIEYGVYQYARPSQKADKQVQYAAGKIQAHGPGALLLMAGDLEVTENYTPSYLDGFYTDYLTGLDLALQLIAWIYTGPGFWNSYVRRYYGRRKLWVAHYGVTVPDMPLGWYYHYLHQFTRKGTVPGIRGGVDLNVENVIPPPSEEELAKRLVREASMRSWNLRL